MFLILRDPHPVIRCSQCHTTERLWNDAQAARWKSAHTLNCPRNVKRENR